MSKKAELREKRRKQAERRRMLTIGLIVVGALLVAWVLIYPSIQQATQPVGNIVVPPPQDYPMPNDNSLGDPNAPVKIVEYSDFQCPFCNRHHQTTERKIFETYVATGKVYYTYRTMGNFLSDNIARYNGVQSSESIDSANAVYCAGEQNLFWEYYDILFANQTGEGVGDYSIPRLKAYAKEIDGLDIKQFNDCLESHKYYDRAMQDYKDGTDAGVTGTPSFVINGQLLVGAQPFEKFQEVIEAELAKAGD